MSSQDDVSLSPWRERAQALLDNPSAPNPSKADVAVGGAVGSVMGIVVGGGVGWLTGSWLFRGTKDAAVGVALLSTVGAVGGNIVGSVVGARRAAPESEKSEAGLAAGVGSIFAGPLGAGVGGYLATENNPSDMTVFEDFATPAKPVVDFSDRKTQLIIGAAGLGLAVGSFILIKRAYGQKKTDPSEVYGISVEPGCNGIVVKNETKYREQLEKFVTASLKANPEIYLEPWVFAARWMNRVASKCPQYPNAPANPLQAKFQVQAVSNILNALVDRQLITTAEADKQLSGFLEWLSGKGFDIADEFDIGGFE